MAIHHSQTKKAEKMGCTIEEVEPDTIAVFWPKRALEICGVSGSDALGQMQAAMVLVEQGYKVRPIGRYARLVNVFSGEGLVLAQCPTTPVAAHKELVLSDTANWSDVIDEPKDEPTVGESLSNGVIGTAPTTASTEPVARSEKGVALDGAVAYREGTPAGDNPFATDEDEEEYDRAKAWDEAWDEAADAAQEEEKDAGGSVVSAKYRTRYAEQGHPTHCGDALAVLLNNICGGKAQTDLDLFEAICKLNNVDTSKYKRDGVGWQGRIRMTGRNLMAKQIFLQGGKMVVPEHVQAEGHFTLPADWMNTQRFKMPKAVQ